MSKIKNPETIGLHGGEYRRYQSKTAETITKYQNN